MRVSLSKEKLNYRFQGENPSVVSGPRQDNVGSAGCEEPALGLGLRAAGGDTER